MKENNKCIGCGLPLGTLCKSCEDKLNILGDVMNKNGLKFTQIKCLDREKGE